MPEATAIEPGSCDPLGATVSALGVNFSVFAKDADLVELLLFSDEDASRPTRVIPLDPLRQHTRPYWQVRVPGVRGGQVYGYRAHGPYVPERGLRFDGEKVLLDPYGRAVCVPSAYSRRAATAPGDNAATAMKSVVVDSSRYDWEGDRPLRRRLADTVLYELHVRGFTRHGSSGVSASRQGTYAGVIDKAVYLRDLGVTAVQLMPVFQFDAQDAPPGLVNYWGYSPISFFAPHYGYSAGRTPLAALNEFRDMVKALHRADIEVLLDVVLDHTSEGAHDGPTQCYRGLANDCYYVLQANDASYADPSGNGNTLNVSHPVVRRLIHDSLRYWANEMHVDGFHFALTALLPRGEQGQQSGDATLLWDLESDPALTGTKFIVDTAGAVEFYQSRRFVGDVWPEWNAGFRNDVRRFVRGDGGMASRLAARLRGRSELGGPPPPAPERRVNFVASHIGFSLNDVVSYNDKHNECNGENNRDGPSDELSFNGGVEGPTDDAAIEQMRSRQVKNFFAIEMLSVGVPLLLMGDEVRRTQRGNNHAYCQDNEISWFDWRLVERHADIHRFVRMLNALRRCPEVAARAEASSLNELLQRSRVEWHGVTLNRPDWGDTSHALAFTSHSGHGRFFLHAMFNASAESLSFQLPVLGAQRTEGWQRCLDTARLSPDDIYLWGDAPDVSGPRYQAQPRSIVLLAAAGRP